MGCINASLDYDNNAIAENLHLMSADKQFRRYDVDLIWGLD